MSSRKSKKSHNPLVLERKLGFWFKQGISRPTKTDKPFIGPPLDDLNRHIKRLNKTWGFESTDTIRNSAVLLQDIDRIFQQLAPSLWPDQPARREALWLVDAQGTTHNGLYPKDLFASNPDDCRTLQNIFTLLIRAKLIKKKLNNDRDARERPLQADLSDYDESSHKRDRHTRRKGSRSTSLLSSESELTQFIETDSEFDNDMAAPPADMYHPPASAFPPSMYHTTSHDSNNSNVPNHQSRMSGTFTPHNNAYRASMTPDTSRPKSRRGESVNEMSPKKKHKKSGAETSTPLNFQPPPNGTKSSSQPRDSVTRGEPSRSTEPPTPNTMPTQHHSTSFPASRKGSRLPTWDFTTPMTTATDEDEDDKPDHSTPAPLPTHATLLKDVRCFFDMSALNSSLRGMSCTPLLSIPDSRALFADIDRLSAIGPHVNTPPPRSAVGVVIDVFDPNGGKLEGGGLVYSPYIDRKTHTQSTFPLFVEDLAEWIAHGEVDPKLWLLMSVQWSQTQQQHQA